MVSSSAITNHCCLLKPYPIISTG